MCNLRTSRMVITISSMRATIALLAASCDWQMAQSRAACSNVVAAEHRFPQLRFLWLYVCLSFLYSQVYYIEVCSSGDNLSRQ